MSPRYTERVEVQELASHEAISDPAIVNPVDVVVETDTDEFEGQQTIHLGVADVENPKAVILAPVAWSDFSSKPFNMIRLGAMAKFGSARVIGIDFPGMGDLRHGRKSELTEKQREELDAGDMSDLAKNYWSAILQQDLLTDSYGNRLPLAIFGNSLGTFTAASLAKEAPENHKIQDLYTSEPMATAVVTTGSMVKSFVIQGAIEQDKYAKKTKEVAPPYDSSGILGLVWQGVRQMSAHRQAFVMLTKGKHLEVIDEAYNTGKLSTEAEHGTRHHLITAEHGITDPSGIARLGISLAYRRLGPRGLLNGQILTGEYHGYQDNVAAVLHQMQRLAVMEAQQ